jgi:amino acid transporter
MLNAVDRRPWLVPLVIFIVACSFALVWSCFKQPLSFTNGPLRQQVYSSLTGSSSSLLGFLLAAVTILAAFGRRSTTTLADQRREEALARARTRLVIVLLTTALLMLVLLLAASTALTLSNSSNRLVLADAVILGAAIGGVAGLVYGCLGLGLAVAERSR